MFSCGLGFRALGKGCMLHMDLEGLMGFRGKGIGVRV
jgi:hypothetical protein